VNVVVRKVTEVAERIRSYELADSGGVPLRGFAPGAHIDVHVPGAGVRQYSLCNERDEDGLYRIAVLDVPDGRGGSHKLHAQVRAGDTLEVSEPRNHFAMAPDARHSVLLAGGIGITPIIAMAEALQARDASYEFVYCCESPARAAFVDRIRRNLSPDRTRIHFDGGQPERRLDLSTLLSTPREGTHLYYCGPQGMMLAAAAASVGWPRHAVHCEHFAPMAASEPAAIASASFTVTLGRSGRRVTVGAGQFLLTALRAAGVEWESSCEAGLCGTCRMQILGGRAQHNDLILSEEDRQQCLLACCARVVDDSLVLDL